MLQTPRITGSVVFDWVTPALRILVTLSAE